MNALNSILSATKEPPYRIIVRDTKSVDFESRDNQITRDFYVRGHLSMHNERMWNPVGELYEYQSVQLICAVDIQTLLTPEEQEEKAAQWRLIDPEGRQVKLVKQNNYLKKTGVTAPFRNVVYKGRVEYE